jgi:hypothetical protein
MFLRQHVMFFVITFVAFESGQTPIGQSGLMALMPSRSSLLGPARVPEDFNLCEKRDR